jgi:hypothetical protein
MTTSNLIYSLDTINSIIFQGFNYTLPENTLKTISEIALQVGAPNYVKTPVFQKKENPIKPDINTSSYQKENFKKKKTKAMEISNDNEWENIKSSTLAFHSTKNEEKDGINLQINNIKTYLNKLTDKNYIDIRNKVVELVDKLIDENIVLEDLSRVSCLIFDIASTNRFYSKLYADLYSDLYTKYEIIRTVFDSNFEKFTDLFIVIEYVDPDENYDKFCEINKKNEKRKAISAFYMNLLSNKIISVEKVMFITKNLLEQIYNFILQDNKKNEVDELTENISILYKKDIYLDYKGKMDFKIGEHSINDIVEKIANSKVKDYKSLTNKSLFKFMDMIDM